MSKRLISLILVMAMVLPMVPVAAGAQTESPSVSNDLTLEAENSFGTLLSNTVSGAEGDDAQEQYDARICDLVVEGTIATVEYTTPVEANLVVAIYTEDGSKLLGSGTAAVSPEETVATVEIEIASMPYYFKAGRTCWMPGTTTRCPGNSKPTGIPRPCRISWPLRWMTSTRSWC